MHGLGVNDQVGLSGFTTAQKIKSTSATEFVSRSDKGDSPILGVILVGTSLSSGRNPVTMG